MSRRSEPFLYAGDVLESSACDKPTVYVQQIHTLANIAANQAAASYDFH